MFEMTRISPPDGASDTQVDVDVDVPSQVASAIIEKRNKLLEIVQRIVEEYINDDGLTFDDALFPSRQQLNGSYYIGGYWITTSQAGIAYPPYVVSVMARCLGRRLAKQQRDLDYLGLNIFLFFDPITQEFLHFGDVDSMVI